MRRAIAREGKLEPLAACEAISTARRSRERSRGPPTRGAASRA